MSAAIGQVTFSALQGEASHDAGKYIFS